MIGKSLNFIRYSCNDTGFVLKQSAVTPIGFGDTAQLLGSIESAHRTSSQYLLKVLYERYGLYDHLSALKQYLLLGQGDFVQYLMDSLGYIFTHTDRL